MTVDSKTLDTSEKDDVVKQTAEAIKRLIDASRFDRSDIKDHLKLSMDQLNRRLLGQTPFLFHEVKAICDFLGVTIDEAMRIAGMSQHEFENAWVYQWRRKALERQVAAIEYNDKISRNAVADRLGFSPSWLSYALNGKKRISSQAARQIEYALSLPDGFLDKEPNKAPETSQIDSDLILRTAKELVASVEADGRKMHSQELYASIIGICQLYNARIAMKEGRTPQDDAVDFSRVYEQLMMHLKLADD
ncbi:hypothetical protein DN730_09755 [Marinomonas piezotolerans]|uniref:HTH cro/C1-type domain-containing protein n=1 Tax=Marinomonas piezotolerans TaxID=2213058 RepID=A0A370UA72_9GAMM|nr:helix-turn-helix transcriptional regulator [Marinomonas piezotolerans]RDL44660.1 hypothetical protein DN730_09755 [Marinomonas piezotolerans]